MAYTPARSTFCVAFASIRYVVALLTLVGPAWAGVDPLASPRMLGRGADEGDVNAQALRGVTYFQEHNYPEALKWFLRAAEQGHAKSQIQIGGMYSDGQGVARDDVEALRWYRKAADQGYALAQFLLGAKLYQGEGSPRDKKGASRWLRKAADQGECHAQYFLGLMYYRGEGVPQSLGDARVWFSKAAEQGEAGAQARLGSMYANGVGVPQNLVQAHKWYNLATARYEAAETKDRDSAAKNRDLIAAKMTPAQIRQSQKLAREWMVEFEARGGN